MTASSRITPEWREYRLVRELASGLLGDVFEARKIFPMRQERACALKFLRADKLHDSQAIAALANEGLIGWDISHHPNLIAFYDFDLWPDGRPFVVTEFIDGPDLSCVMELLQGDYPTIQRIARDMLAALGHLHHHGIVHRDVAPQNILIDSCGAVKLADLGLAIHVSECRAGSICGTPAYVAPERHRGVKPSFASDLYGVGAVLYELISGRPPYGWGTFDELIEQIELDVPELPPTTPANLRKLIMALLDVEENRPSITEATRILADSDAWVARDQVVTDFVCAWNDHCAVESGEPQETANVVPLNLAVKEFLAEATEPDEPERGRGDDFSGVQSGRRRTCLFVAACVALVLAVFGYHWSEFDQREDKQPASLQPETKRAHKPTPIEPDRPVGESQPTRCTAPSGEVTEPSDTPVARADKPRAPSRGWVWNK